jgi:hypothetical protein
MYRKILLFCIFSQLIIKFVYLFWDFIQHLIDDKLNEVSCNNYYHYFTTIFVLWHATQYIMIHLTLYNRSIIVMSIFSLLFYQQCSNVNHFSYGILSMDMRQHYINCCRNNKQSTVGNDLTNLFAICSR